MRNLFATGNIFGGSCIPIYLIIKGYFGFLRGDKSGKEGMKMPAEEKSCEKICEKVCEKNDEKRSDSFRKLVLAQKSYCSRSIVHEGNKKNYSFVNSFSRDQPTKAQTDWGSFGDKNSVLDKNSPDWTSFWNFQIGKKLPKKNLITKIRYCH